MTEACLGTVLLVEDDGDVRQAISEILRESHYAVLEYANGQEALASTGAGEPCVILLDMMMPVMDGWQFRALQRNDPHLGKVPVVVLTAHADAGHVAEQLGAAAFLKKPVQLEALLDTIKRFCDPSPVGKSDPRRVG
jgi:CheY-like chemotaxis protein